MKLDKDSLKVMDISQQDIVEIKTAICEIREDVSSIMVVQTEQATVLREHVRRTDVLEDKVVPLAEDKLVKDKLWEWCGRAWAGIAAIAGTAFGIYETYKYVKGL